MWGFALFTRLKNNMISAVIFVIVLLLVSVQNVSGGTVSLLLQPSGQVSFAPTLFGQNKFSDLEPGYRTDLFVYMDLFKYDQWIFSFYTSNTTLISRDASTLFTLDRIRYTLAPGFRHVFRKWVASGMLFHECIHTISRPEKNGSVYWNTIRIGTGTKGAYHFYLVDKYMTRDFTLRNSIDVRLDVDFYLRGDAFSLIAQNHQYRLGSSELIRYHFDFLKRQFFADCAHRFWLEDDSIWTQKLSAALNWVLPGRKKLATFFFQYTLFDDNPYDNEDTLGVVGFRMVF